MTRLMASSSQALGQAQSGANPAETLAALDNLDRQSADLGMSLSICQTAMAKTTSYEAGDDAVQELLVKLAGDAGVELSPELSSKLNEATPSTAEPQITEPTAEEEDSLQQKLKKLRVEEG